MYCETEMEVSRRLDNRYYISRNQDCIRDLNLSYLNITKFSLVEDYYFKTLEERNYWRQVYHT